MGLTKKKTSISESVYIIFMVIVILRQFLGTTVFELEWAEKILLMCSFIIGICLVVKILAEWKKTWGCRDIAMAVITVGFLAIGNFYISHPYLWEYILLIIGARNVSSKKIVRTYLFCVIPLVAATIGASLLGIIDNLIFYRNAQTDTPRYALGFYYATNLGAHLFFICAAWAFLRGKALKYLEILLMAAIGIGCYVLTEGRNSTICIGFLVIALIIMKLRHGKCSDENENTKHPIFDFVFPTFMPILAIVSVVIAFIYRSDSKTWEIINSVMGHRPQMDAEAFDRFNVTLWGQNFMERLYGGESLIGFPNNYFYIDCSYVSILLKMGIMAVVAILVMWFTITYRQCKKKNYYAALVLCIVSFHCFMESNILNISYNPFFLLLFSDKILEYWDIKPLSEFIKNKLAKININTRIVKNCLGLILFSVIIELLAFNMQSITTVFRSYLEEYSVNSYGMTSVGGSEYAVDSLCYVAYTNVVEKPQSLMVDVSLYSAEDNSFLYDKDYVVTLCTFDYELNKTVPVEQYTINTSKPSSGYIELDINEDKEYDQYLLELAFDEPCIIRENKIAFNGPKPFDISFLRLLIIYLFMVIVYYFGIEKKNAEVSEAEIELHKAQEDFTSTGALRTEAHKNMRAVYEKKSPIYVGIKRLFDITMSGIAILLLLPLFLATAIAIKIEDKGPVFFAQYRAGKDLKPFKMWKFRSMYVNADEKLKELMKGNEQTGHAFKIKDDPRITKVGKFIRKYSIDELPQLFNVFLGDMSIVGPRPILVFQMEECDEYDRQRLIVQPGLTCIWQVSGRANIKWDKWVELDLDYIDKMSLYTDLKLIFLTVPVVVTGDGAF